MKTLLRLVALLLAVQASLLVRGDTPHPKVLGAFVQISAFQKAVMRFHADMGRYPSAAEGLAALYHAPATDAARWKGPYLKADLPVDPWTNPYRYCCPAQRSSAAFDIWSLGPDGRESDDDVGNWTKL